jgi:hypothetical protein
VTAVSPPSTAACPRDPAARRGRDTDVDAVMARVRCAAESGRTFTLRSLTPTASPNPRHHQWGRLTTLLKEGLHHIAGRAASDRPISELPESAPSEAPAPHAEGRDRSTILAGGRTPSSPASCRHPRRQLNIAVGPSSSDWYALASGRPTTASCGSANAAMARRHRRPDARRLGTTAPDCPTHGTAARSPATCSTWSAARLRPPLPRRNAAMVAAAPPAAGRVLTARPVLRTCTASARPQRRHPSEVIAHRRRCITVAV